MEEYIYKLNSVFKSALIDFIKVHPEQYISNFKLNIKSVLEVYPEPSISDIKPHELLSGKRINLDFNGSVRVEINLENGTTTRNFSFMCLGIPVEWDSDIEGFKVGPIEDLITAGFSRF